MENIQMTHQFATKCRPNYLGLQILIPFLLSLCVYNTLSYQFIFVNLKLFIIHSSKIKSFFERNILLLSFRKCCTKVIYFQCRFLIASEDSHRFITLHQRKLNLQNRFFRNLSTWVIGTAEENLLGEKGIKEAERKQKRIKE